MYDYSGIKGFMDEEGKKLAREVEVFIDNLKEYDLLQLVDVRNSYADLQAVAELKRLAKKIMPHVKKSAVIGVKRIQKVILETVNLFSGIKTKAFDNVEEAKDWLIED